MNIIINAFLGAIGTGILTLIVVAIKWFIKKIKCDDKTLKALAHDALFRQAKYMLQGDDITREELENIGYLYEGYKAQGLNGTGEELYRRCKEMPLRKEKHKETTE